MDNNGAVNSSGSSLLTKLSFLLRIKKIWNEIQIGLSKNLKIFNMDLSMVEKLFVSMNNLIVL